MKKISLMVMIMFMLLVGCAQEKKGVTYIKTTEVMEKMDNKDSFVLVIGSSTCAACIAYQPVLEEIVKNKGVEIFYVQYDTERLTKDQKVDEQGEANIKKLFEEYLDDKIKSTPSTLSIKDGQVVEIKEAVLSYTDLIEWLNQQGLELKK